MTLLIVLLSAMFGLLRLFVIHGHGLSWPGTFESAAHIWVGFLFCLALFRKEWRKVSWWSLGVISLGVEATMFFVQNPSYQFWRR